MHLLLFSFGLLCAVALYKLRHETREAIQRMPSVVFLFAYPVTYLYSAVEWWRWWVRREVFTVIVLALTVFGAAACVPGQAEARARTSLDILADVIDPAWALAEDGCLARQRVEQERENAGLTKPADTDATLASIRVKCDAVTNAFEKIRTSHLQAQQLLEQGKVADAEAALQDILKQWQALRSPGTADGGSS